MDNFDTEIFISEIENRPAIWDNSSPDYSNRDLKKKCWEEIVDIFGGRDLSILEKKDLGETLQKKWKSIRGCFTREVKRKKELKSGSGGISGSRKTEYIYFPQLQFLQNVVHFKEQDVSEELAEQSPDNDISTDRTIKRIKRKEKITEDDLILENKRQKREKSEHDDDRLFLLSLLGTLKKVPQQQKMATKIRIMTLLDEATHNNEITRPVHAFSTGNSRPGNSSQRVEPDIIKAESPEYSPPVHQGRLILDTNDFEESDSLLELF